jgi:rare lipoprotein A (peptidoglycan hydrolase)
MISEDETHPQRLADLRKRFRLPSWRRRSGRRRIIRAALMVTVPVSALIGFVGIPPANPTPAAAGVEASYYGEEFAGRATASGEVFNPAEYTAAHRTLPFGSLVEVVNAASGKSVVVKINDRGPYHGNREIDLSEAAAQKIEMPASGTSMVSLDVVGQA